MMDWRDPYRSAKLLLDRHGADAAVVAALGADEMDQQSDEAGRRALLAVIAAIDELSRTDRLPSELLQ